MADKLGSATIGVSVSEKPTTAPQVPIQIDDSVIDVSSIQDINKFTTPEKISLDEEEYDFDKSSQDKLKQLLRRK